MEKKVISDFKIKIKFLGNGTYFWFDEQLTIPPVVIKSAFIELFDKAACIQHWHNTGKNDEGMVVSSEAVYELWEALKKYRDLRNSL